MPESASLILALGGILLLGMAADVLGRRTLLPRVSLLVIVGIAIGPALLNLIPPVLVGNFNLIATMALIMIGFLLGGKLTRQSLTHIGRRGLLISFSAAAGTAAIVCVGLLLLGVGIEFALLLGCISSATAPAATFDTVVESGTTSPFSRLLLMVVTLDDAWGLILFSLALAAVSAMQGLENAASPLLVAAQDIGGGAAIGLIIGLPAAYLTGRIRPGEPMLTEALGLAFLCGGVAIWADVSFLIAAMVMGAVVANLATHHEYPFHAIEDIEWPFLVVFFVLAGASLELGALFDAGIIGLAYIVLRVIGKTISAAAGCAITREDPATRRWLGLALLPQAGVAVGMALVATRMFPERHAIILPIVLGATVIFEIVGPVFTRRALTATQN